MGVEDLTRALEWRVSPERIAFPPATPSDLVSTKPLDDCRFAISVFPTFTNTRPSEQRTDLAWADVVQRVAAERPLVLEDKKHGTAVIMGTLAPNKEGVVARRDECVGDLTAMAVDLDKVSEEDVHRYVGQLDDAGIEYSAYTTHSHGKDGQSRYRVVLPLDQPVNRTEFGRLASIVNATLFDGQSDTNSEKASQLAQVWAAHPDREALARKWGGEGRGRPLSVEALRTAAAHRTHNDSPSARAANADLIGGEAGVPPVDRMREALEWLDPNDYDEWTWTLPLLKAWGMGPNEAAAKALWLDFTERAAADRKENNHRPGTDPQVMWDTVKPTAPAGGAAGAILARARDAALEIARQDSGKREWSEQGGRAAKYLADHHTKALVKLDEAGCPEIPDTKAQGSAFTARQVLGATSVFLDQYGAANALFEEGGRLVCVPLESSHFKDSLLLQTKRAGGKLPGKEALEREIQIRRAEAREKGTRQQVFVRVGREGDDYLLDLGDREGNMCRVSEGSWTVERNSAIAWRRQDGYGELPRPVHYPGAHAAWEAIEALWRVARVPEQLRLPLIAVMIEWLRPETAHPVVELHGPAGSGKSTIGNAVAQLLDPTLDKVTPNVMLKWDALAALGQRRHTLFLDNKSGLSKEQQDLACVCATGGAFADRKLYFQGDASILSVHRPLIIAAITPVATQVDLLDRTLRIPLPATSSNTGGEADRLWSGFDSARPKILGGLVSLFALVRARVPEVRVRQKNWRHRLVDFEQTGEALSQLLGYKPGHFQDVLAGLRSRQASEIAEGDTLARSVIRALQIAAERAETAAVFPHYERWPAPAGLPTNAIGVTEGATGKCCSIRHPDKAIEVRLQAAWMQRQVTALVGQHERTAIPTSARAMTSALTRITPMLRDIGICAERVDLDGPKVAGWRFFVESSKADAVLEWGK